MNLKGVISEEQKAMARFAKAMGHPVRMYVLELLSRQTCCYSGDLTEVLPIAKSTLSQHLKDPAGPAAHRTAQGELGTGQGAVQLSTEQKMNQ